MKKFANAEIEVVKFNNAVIATSGCTSWKTAVNYNRVIEEMRGAMTPEEYYEYSGFEFYQQTNEIGVVN